MMERRYVSMSPSASIYPWKKPSWAAANQEQMYSVNFDFLNYINQYLVLFHKYLVVVHCIIIIRGYQRITMLNYIYMIKIMGTYYHFQLPVVAPIHGENDINHKMSKKRR